MTYIELNSVSKRIRNKYVLEKISYRFESGKIYGLYGRNGSGKTMLLRAIAGLIQTNEGEVTVNDKVLHKDISFPPNMGLIIENMSLLPQFDAVKNLEILSRIRKVATMNDIENTLDRVGLGAKKNIKVKEYSLGMKQRLNIAQVLFEKPDIILLDEPTNAIDEEGITEVRNILLEEKERGALIIIASHNTQDLDILSDSIIKMDNGKLFV